MIVTILCRIYGSTFNVIVENEDQVEISFKRFWDVSMAGKMVPLNIDKRSYIALPYKLVITFYLLDYSL